MPPPPPPRLQASLQLPQPPLPGQAPIAGGSGEFGPAASGAVASRRHSVVLQSLKEVGSQHGGAIVAPSSAPPSDLLLVSQHSTPSPSSASKPPRSTRTHSLSDLPGIGSALFKPAHNTANDASKSSIMILHQKSPHSRRTSLDGLVGSELSAQQQQQQQGEAKLLSPPHSGVGTKLAANGSGAPPHPVAPSGRSPQLGPHLHSPPLHGKSMSMSLASLSGGGGDPLLFSLDRCTSPSQPHQQQHQPHQQMRAPRGRSPSLSDVSSVFGATVVGNASPSSCSSATSNSSLPQVPAGVAAGPAFSASNNNNKPSPLRAMRMLPGVSGATKGAWEDEQQQQLHSLLQPPLSSRALVGHTRRASRTQPASPAVGSGSSSHGLNSPFSAAFAGGGVAGPVAGATPVEDETKLLSPVHHTFHHHNYHVPHPHPHQQQHPHHQHHNSLGGGGSASHSSSASSSASGSISGLHFGASPVTNLRSLSLLGSRASSPSHAAFMSVVGSNGGSGQATTAGASGFASSSGGALPPLLSSSASTNGSAAASPNLFLRSFDRNGAAAANSEPRSSASSAATAATASTPAGSRARKMQPLPLSVLDISSQFASSLPSSEGPSACSSPVAPPPSSSSSSSAASAVSNLLLRAAGGSAALRQQQQQQQDANRSTASMSPTASTGTALFYSNRSPLQAGVGSATSAAAAAIAQAAASVASSSSSSSASPQVKSRRSLSTSMRGSLSSTGALSSGTSSAGSPTGTPKSQSRNLPRLDALVSPSVAGGVQLPVPVGSSPALGVRGLQLQQQQSSQQQHPSPRLDHLSGRRLSPAQLAIAVAAHSSHSNSSSSTRSASPLSTPCSPKLGGTYPLPQQQRASLPSSGLAISVRGQGMVLTPLDRSSLSARTQAGGGGGSLPLSPNTPSAVAMMPLLQQLQQQRQQQCASPTPTTPSSSHDGLDGGASSSSTESTPARPAHRHQQQRSQQQQLPPASEPKLASSSVAASAASIVAPSLLIEVDDATLETDVASIPSPVPVVVETSLPTEATAAAAPVASSSDLASATTTTVAAAPAAAAPMARPPGQANRLRFASMAIVSANPICVPDPALFDNTDVTPLSASPQPDDEDDAGQNLDHTVVGRAGSPSPVTPITAAAEAAFEARTAAALAAAAAASSSIDAANDQHNSEPFDEELPVPTRRSSEVFHGLTRNGDDDADDDDKAALRAVVDAAASSASSSPAGPALPLILPSAPVGLGGCGDERDGGFGFEPQQHEQQDQQQQQGSVVIPPLPLTLVLPDAPPASFDNYYRANINENGSTTNSPQNVLRTVGGIGAAAAVPSAVTMAGSGSGRNSRAGAGGVGLSSHATASAVRPVSAKGLSIQLLQSPNSGHGASLPASAQQQQQQRCAEEIVPYDDEYGYDEDAEDDAVDFWEAMDSGAHRLF